MDGVSQAKPGGIAALPPVAFLTLGGFCEAGSLSALAAASQVPQERWGDLAATFGLQPKELKVAAENHRAFAVAGAFLARAGPSYTWLLDELKGADLVPPLQPCETLWSRCSRIGAPRAQPRGRLAQFPEVMEVLKKVKVQKYPHALPWSALSVRVASHSAELHQVWQSASAAGAEAFDGTAGSVDCRFWLAPGLRAVRRHRDMVAESDMASGSVAVHIMPSDFRPMPARECLCSWADESSAVHLQSYLTSPGLSFAENVETHNKSAGRGKLAQTTGRGAQAQLAVAAAVLALKAAGKTLRRIVSVDALHGFGVRGSADLLVDTDEGLTAVEFFAQARHNFRKAVLGDPPEWFPEKVFQNLICAAKLACPNALTVFYSYQASTVYWQLTPVPPVFRRFVADITAAWFPDGRLRLELFQVMARRELSRASLAVRLAQLPRDVCAQPFCLAGVRCRKHRHLYEVRDAPACSHYTGRGRCKHGDMCRNHHGGGVIPYEPDDTEPEWGAAGASKGSKKEKKQRGPAAQASPAPAGSSVEVAVATLCGFILDHLRPQI